MSTCQLPAMSAAMDGLLPGREPLSQWGGGDLLGLICPELGVTPLVGPGGGRRRVHASVSDVGRRRGSGAGSLGGGGLAGNGDACCGIFPDPSDISCASGSLDVGRGLVSTGGGSSCWSGGGESGLERDPVVPGFPACFGDFLWTTPSLSVSRPAPGVGPPSSSAAADQELPWSASLPLELSTESTLLPAPLTPSRMVVGVVIPGRWCPPWPGIPR